MRNAYRFRTPKGVRSEETKAIGTQQQASRQASKRAAGLFDALVQQQQ